MVHVDPLAHAQRKHHVGAARVGGRGSKVLAAEPHRTQAHRRVARRRSATGGGTAATRCTHTADIQALPHQRRIALARSTARARTRLAALLRLSALLRLRHPRALVVERALHEVLVDVHAKHRCRAQRLRHVKRHQPLVTADVHHPPPREPLTPQRAQPRVARKARALQPEGVVAAVVAVLAHVPLLGPPLGLLLRLPRRGVRGASTLAAAGAPRSLHRQSCRAQHLPHCRAHASA